MRICAYITHILIQCNSLIINIFIQKTHYKDYQESNTTLLNHTPHREDRPPRGNMILMNNVIHSNGSAHSPLRAAKLHHRSHTTETPTQSNPFYDNSERGLLTELVFHVKQINEELRQRHITRNAVDYYKSEWRMVALVLDRILLIVFFIITVFTCVIIFINVPHGYAASRG